jgi:hypothetical protein
MCSEPVAGRAYSNIHAGEAEALFAGIALLRAIVGLAAIRAVNDQRVGHPVFNLRGSLSFLPEMQEYVDGSAILSLAIDNDVEVHRLPSSTRMHAVLLFQALAQNHARFTNFSDAEFMQ